MRLIGIMPVRNEAYVLGLTARAALMWCDDLVVLDHASTDTSESIARKISRENPERVHVFHSDDPTWDEMKHRQAMLELARAFDATHIAIIDADEIVCGGLVNPTHHEDGAVTIPLRTVCSTLAPGSILQLPGYNLRGSLQRYHSSGIWADRWFSTAFADDKRLHWGGDRFHHREPMGMELKPYRPIQQGQGGIMHLWGASERRLKAKSAYYKITERLRWPERSVREIDEMYSWAIHGRPGVPSDVPSRWQFADVPEAWWAPYRDLMKYLDLDAEPWQEAACRDAIKEHGPRMFQGLDLFGIV